MKFFLKILLTLSFICVWYLRSDLWHSFLGSKMDSLFFFVLVFALMILPIIGIVYLIIRALKKFDIFEMALAATLTLLTCFETQIGVDLLGLFSSLILGLLVFSAWGMASLLIDNEVDKKLNKIGVVILLLNVVFMLDPQSSARLFVAGYSNPVEASKVTLISNDIDFEKKTTNYGFYKTKSPVVVDPGLFAMQPEVNNYSSVSISVKRFGIIYYSYYQLMNN